MQSIMRSTLSFAAVAIFVWAAPAAAQDAGQVGITMGYPASIGLIWHVSDRIGIRPEVSLLRATSESTLTVSIPIPGVPTTSQVITSESWQAATGASALFYLVKGEALRTYISPRFTYLRSSSTGTTFISSSTVVTPSTTVTSNYGVSGSVGAQYAIGKRFGLFGEAGLAYTRSTSAPDAATFRPDSKATTVGLRSGVGVILYFGS